MEDTIINDASLVCERLLNSEEHAVEDAVPQVAFDAAELIGKLVDTLQAAQTALSQALQHSEKTDKFVQQVAGLSIWGYGKDDGTVYEECETPSEGTDDSHTCLMELIEQARGICNSPVRTASNANKDCTPQQE